MICVRLAGGLGNQLFQLACALDTRSDGESILLATNALNSYKTARTPDVQRIVNLDALGVAIGPAPRPFVSSAMALRLPRIFPSLGLSDRNFTSCSPRRHISARRTLLLDGYFQSGWHGSRLESSIVKIAAALRGPAAKSTSIATAVHVRGTDFLSSASHQLISVDYYKRAFDELVRRQAIATVIVVTDDPVYARDLLAPVAAAYPHLQFDFPQTRTSIESDFAILCSAASRIIPNSTFSWWAAALDAHRSPTISPDRFVKESARHVLLSWETSIPADPTGGATA